MSNQEDNTNGIGSNTIQRLASLKAPRDLLLGGVKPNKKVFTPNLNVTRNKNKGTSTALKEHKKVEKNKRDKKNDRNRNFKNGPNIVKSSGVFSEGMGSAERHSSRASYGRDVNAEPKLQRPTIRVKDVIKIDKELEDQKIKAILSEDGKEIEEAEDFKQVLETDAPVILPMDDGGNILTGWSSGSVKIKKELVIKLEPSDDGDILTAPEEKPIPDVKEIFEDVSVANLMKSDKPTLILLQLSDTLPGRGGSGDDDRKKPVNQPSSSSEEVELKPPVDTRCRLADLEEGRIGKLRVHRSGRVTLALGDTIFEVSSGTKASFYQEVVSVSVDDRSHSANMISLGPLQHKLNVTPDWQAMFDEMAIKL